MKRRPGLSSRPIEFMPRRFYFVMTREVAPCVLKSAKCGDDSSSSNSSSSSPESFPSSMRTLFPRTPGIQFVSLHDQLPRQRKPEDNDDGEFDLGIPQTLRFNAFLTRHLTSTACSRPMTSEPHTRSGASGVHQHSPQYFFVRRERLAEVVKAVHLICRWRLLFLGLSPQEALAPFEHLPFLFSTFFAPQCSFQPPNLLGSLLGIAKGIASDLLAVGDMELWQCMGSVGGRSGDDEEVGEQEAEAQAMPMPMLLPISRRLVVCRERGGRIRKGRRTRVAADKTDDSRADGVQGCPDTDVQSGVETDEWSTQRLVSRLKSAGIALTIVLSGGEPVSGGTDDSTVDGSASVAVTSLASSGLTVLDLSAAFDMLSSESVDASNGGFSHRVAAASAARDESVVDRFLDACEQTQGTIAVGSTAMFRSLPTDEGGSALTISTATCVGCYLMKHHGFTSQEAVGWIRYCCPDEISLAHQLFLDEMQPRMWREGERFRRRQQQQADAESAMLLEDGSASRLGSQISIGRISLGRDSLFGTKSSGRSEDGDLDDRASFGRLNRHHQSHLSLHQHLQSSQQHAQDDTSPSDEDDGAMVDDAVRLHSPVPSYAGASSMMGKQRRPMTQGSAISARRRHRPSDGAGFARADFSLLHKFVHQTTVPRANSIDDDSRAPTGYTTSAGLAVGSAAVAAAVARAATAETTALARRTADVAT